MWLLEKQHSNVIIMMLCEVEGILINVHHVYPSACMQMYEIQLWNLDVP